MPRMMSSEVAAEVGRLGGLARHAKYGSDALLAGARAALEAKLIKQVDPDGTLSPDEMSAALARARSEQARRAWQTRRDRERARQEAAS